MGVARARRRESAGGGAAFDGPLVPLDEADEASRCPHRPPARSTVRNSSRTSPASCSYVSSGAAGRAPTSSHPGASTPVAAASATSARRRRRRRLRVTAVPTARPMAKATRGGAVAGSGRKRHHKCSVPARRSDRRSSSNRRRSWIRPIKSGQAVNRWRPFKRRDLMMARPARVRMRARKPCLRARRRVLGWYVRFTGELRGDRQGEPKRGGHRPRAAGRNAPVRPAKATATRANPTTEQTHGRRPVRTAIGA